MTDATTRVVSIVDKNSGNDSQPETAALHTIKQIAKHAGIDPATVDQAIDDALEDGRLEEVDGRYRVPQ
ncbi:helix-turn-helix domain-containing protein (plasmid) [Natrialbaceae archaeon A-CW2]